MFGALGELYAPVYTQTVTLTRNPQNTNIVSSNNKLAFLLQYNFRKLHVMYCSLQNYSGRSIIFCQLSMMHLNVNKRAFYIYQWWYRFGLAMKLQNSESFHPELDFLSV